MEVIEAKPRQTATAEAVSLVWHPHPVTPIAGREIRACEWTPGRTVRETLLFGGIDPQQPIVVLLDDRLLAVDEWDHVCPSPGQLLNVQATVLGGGGGSNPLATVATLALVIAAPYMTTALVGIEGAAALGSIGVSMVTAGIMVAGTMVIGAIFPPALPSSGYGNMAAASPTYSLTGGSNRARPYEPIPVIFGTHRLFPDLGNRPYTEFRGEDQYLFQIFNLGLSTLSLSGWSIGSSPITDYADYTWYSPDSDGKITAFPGNVDTASGAVLTQAASWVTRTTSSSTYQIGLDVQATLYYGNDQGGLDQRTATLEVQIAVAGSGNWQTPSTITAQGTGASIAGNVITMTGASQTPRRATIFITPDAPGIYDVRMRRTSADSTLTREKTDTSWDSIKSYQSDTASYVGQNRIGLSIRASEQLNGALQQISVLASAQATYWNGASWVTGPTSNPAHWFADFAHGRKDSTGRLVYGLGMPDSQIDLAALNSWAAYCAAESLSCNMVLDSQRTAADMLSIIARCGLASPSWGSGRLGVVWDTRNAAPVAAFGMANIVRGSFTVSYITEQLAEEIVVRFVNQDKDWAQDEVRVTVPGVASPQLVSTVELMGCTSQAMAGKYSNYLAAQQFYRRRRITWETDFEGFVCQRGDVVLLSHDLTQWGYSGRAVAISGNTITLDRTVPRSGGADYLMLRQPNGTMTTYTVSAGSGDSDTLTLTSTPAFQSGMLAMDHIWSFSPLATPGKLVKITTVEPQSESRLRVTATDEDPAFYAAWDGTFNAAAASTLLTDSTPLIMGLIVSPTVTRTLTGEATTHVVVRWTLQAGTQERAIVRYRMGGDWQSLETSDRSATFDIRGTGTVEVAVTAVNGAITGNTLNSTAVAAIPTTGPASPTSAASGLMFATRITWTFGDTRSDIAGTEVWYSTTNDRTTAARLTFEPFPATDYTHPGLAPGQGGYYWTRVVDVWGNSSAWYPGGATSGMYAAASSDPAQLLTQLKNAVGLEQLTADLAQPITTTPGSLHNAALAVLQSALSDYDLTSRMQWQETVTNATITLDPITGRIQLLATASVTTDVEMRLTSVEVLANADHATLVSTVSSLTTTQSTLVTAQSQITQLQNTISVGASQVYVDNAINNATGALTVTAANSATAMAQAELQSALDAFANGTTLSGLTANVANAQATLSAVATALDSEATSRSMLVATVAATGAAVVSESAARASAVSAVASQITLLQARLDTGDYAAVVQEASATASALGGVLAQYVLKVDANGHISAIKLLSNGNESSLVFLADKVLFVAPDGSGTPKQLMILGQVNGTTTVGIDGTLVVDGTIVARHLSVSTLSAITANLGNINAGNISIGGGSAVINNDGSAYFNNITVVRNLSVATGSASSLAGTYSISSGSGWTLLNTVTVDTGYVVGAWWSSTDRIYQATAGIASGTVWVNAWGGNFGTFIANWSAVVKRIYPKSRWNTATTMMLELELWAEVDGSIYNIQLPAPTWALFKVT